ncbi:MAG: hypothetical protein J1F40_01480 [Prevotellaceae bacterium]|nr:hypothetical protein [Prevotellaceae bacterium]
MKEKILNAFQNLGFAMEYMEEVGYGFDYESLHYLWMNNGDEEFLCITIPAVFDKSDSDELEFYQVIDKLNSTLKYVKVNEVNNSMWLFYEREMIGDEDFEKLLPKMIFHLEHAVRFLRNGGQNTNNDNDADAINGNRIDDGDCIVGDVDLLSDNN